MSMVLHPEQSNWIQRTIDELRADTPGDWPRRVCKDMLNGLPLASNLIFMWAIRSDGAIVCLDHEAFGWRWEIETDPVVVYAVLLRGALCYPELQALVPAQPSNARRCNTCKGTGLEDPEGHVCCLGCSGLGWYRID